MEFLLKRYGRMVWRVHPTGACCDETVINPREFGPVFRSTPRWEILVVDEGQRRKFESRLAHVSPHLLQ